MPADEEKVQLERLGEPLAKVVGRAIRALRTDLGLSQEGLARQCQEQGLLDWTRDTVAATEIGRRLPSLAEALGLSLALGCALEALIGKGSEVVDLAAREGPSNIPPRLHSTQTLRSVIRGEKFPEPGRKKGFGRPPSWAVRLAVSVWAPEFDHLAQERFNVSVEEIDQVASELWGRPAYAEHEDRVQQRTPDGAKARSIGVIRGHVTREMLREVASYLESGGN